MVGVCFASLALLGGMLGLFGLSWFKRKRNGGKQKQTNKQEEEVSQLTV